MDPEKEKLVNSIVKGIAYAENGGEPNLANPSPGQSGEMKSIFQFTPDTWKGYSKEVFGKDVPLDNDTETYVVQQKVSKWIDEGRTAAQIASMWNAGPGKPDAYKENWKGTNSKGVSYDTPKYAKQVVSYAQKFYRGDATSQQDPHSEVANNLLSVVKSAQTKQNSPQSSGGLMGQLIQPKI